MLLFSFYLCYCCDNALLLCYFLLCYWSGFINYNANSQNINGCAFSYAKWYSKNASCSLKLIYMTCLMDAVVKKTKRIKYINLLVLSLTDNCHLCFSIFFHGHINYVRDDCCLRFILIQVRIIEDHLKSTSCQVLLKWRM
jgi:hypothetical protein